MSSTVLKKQPKKRLVKTSSKKRVSSTKRSARGTLAVEDADNVFEQLGFTREESRVFVIKAELLGALRKRIAELGYTQRQVAKLWGEKQPRVGEIARGQLESVSIDKLIDCLGRLGISVEVKVKKSA